MVRPCHNHFVTCRVEGKTGRIPWREAVMGNHRHNLGKGRFGVGAVWQLYIPTAEHSVIAFMRLISILPLLVLHGSRRFVGMSYIYGLRAEHGSYVGLKILSS